MMAKDDDLSIIHNQYYSTSYRSPMGIITLIGDKENIVGLWLEGQINVQKTLCKQCIIKDDVPVFIQIKIWLEQYFNKDKPSIDELPLAPIGSEFRKNVWKLLCDIPYGEVTNYGEIAKKIALIMGKDKMSAQAVGGAIKHNPISIIIPCHRVIGSDGSMTGYSGGIDKKVQLLEFEGVLIL